jgi:hypothetical protein
VAWIKKTTEWRRNKVIEVRRAIFEKYGKRCKRCGFSDERALCVDHIHGGGRKERRVLTPYKFYEKVLKDKAGLYQILCHNCNWIKVHENKEFVGRPRFVVEEGEVRAI